MAHSDPSRPDHDAATRSARLYGHSLEPAEIGSALRQGRITLAWQPVMPSRGTHQPAFHEALMRLRLPCGDIVTPGRFLPAIGTGPLARALDRHVLGLALRALRDDPALRVSVNAAPASLVCPQWLAALQCGLSSAGPTVTERLILEITEHAPLPHASDIARPLAAARAAGLCLALDDFGAGQTAFRHLRDWRFDIIKVAGCFAEAVDRCADNQVLFRTLAGLAHHFEAMVVAEGVETAAEAAWLRGAGIDALQGYHIARPTFDAPGHRAAAAADATRQAG
jgi:EAL domain-containing protein (putative c-di-GMP-specific phosphodiesterase class I)